MYIIFGNIGSWEIPIIRILKYLRFKVFYIYIRSKSEIQKDKIAISLKKKNIIPLPIEFEKEISPKASYSLFIDDPEEHVYKKSVKMVDDKILKKYCKLFSIHEEKVKKIRFLILDVIASQQTTLSARIGVWSRLRPSEKIIFLDFKTKSFFTTDVGDNVIKIIIPLDIIGYLVKTIIKFPLIFSAFKKKNVNYSFSELEKKRVALVTHKGTMYGSGTNVLFEKSLYYSDDKNSCLNKHNILHLDYSNYSSPENNIYWVCLKKSKTSNIKIFIQTLLACFKTCFLIRSWSTFLIWALCNQQYFSYLKYCEIVKKFKKLKIAIIDYDILCPKTLILAFEKNNVKTIATQERFVTMYFKSYANVMLDTYYVASAYAANVIRKSSYYDVKKIIPMGQYRGDYISLYKDGTVPEEISKAKNSGKKILVVFGNDATYHWIDSYTEPILNWSAQINFLEDCIKLSKNLTNTFIILRFKNLFWSNNKYFKNIMDKINDCENLIISSRYESVYAYKLCAYADLVIAKHTSIADECLSKGIPVLFHEYTHNMKKIFKNIPNYLPANLICYDFDELYQKSKSFLFLNSNKLKEEVKKLNETIYYIDEKKNIKNKILKDLENQLIENKNNLL